MQHYIFLQKVSKIYEKQYNCNACILTTAIKLTLLNLKQNR